MSRIEKPNSDQRFDLRSWYFSVAAHQFTNWCATYVMLTGDQETADIVLVALRKMIDTLKEKRT